MLTHSPVRLLTGMVQLSRQHAVLWYAYSSHTNESSCLKCLPPVDVLIVPLSPDAHLLVKSTKEAVVWGGRSWRVQTEWYSASIQGIIVQLPTPTCATRDINDQRGFWLCRLKFNGRMTNTPGCSTQIVRESEMESGKPELWDENSSLM